MELLIGQFGEFAVLSFFIIVLVVKALVVLVAIALISVVVFKSLHKNKQKQIGRKVYKYWNEMFEEIV